jgi:hypothetical protein
MTYKLDDTDRDILEFRPNIAFIEPDQQPGVIKGVDEPQLEDVQDARNKIKKLAQAVNTLATAVQARVDQRAANMFIQLNKDADTDAVHAMLRRFPDADPYKITYAQYRECRNAIRAKGEEIGKQALITTDQVEEARAKLAVGGAGLYVPGGFNKDGAQNGALRPENDANSYVIPPLNIEKVQIDLICILVNFIWKNFIKTAMKGLPLIGAAVFALPDKLCDPGFEGEGFPGLQILGDTPNDLLSGRTASKKVSETAQKAADAGIKGLDNV